MKQAKYTFSRWMHLLLWAMLPYMLLAVAAIALPFQEIQSNRRIECDRVMTLNGERIAQHLNCVPQAITLLLDSQPLREALKTTANTDGTIKPGDLYYTVGMPISYRNVLSNRAISAITVYSEGRLAFYSLQQTTTDHALSRCGAVLYNANTISEGGSYMVPSMPNGYVYFVQDFTDIYDGRLLGQIVVEVESVPTYESAHTPTVSPYDYQVDLSAYLGTQYLVYDTQGTVFFSNNPQNVGAKLEHILPEKMVRGTRVVGALAGYSIYSRSLYKPSMTAVMITPEDSITSSVSEVQQQFFAIAFCIGILLLIAIFMFIRYTITPFIALMQHCQKTQAHPTTPITFSPIFHEVQTVQETLSKRAAQIEDMQAVIMKNHLQMKDNEIQLLQAQINPHFLFNMLDIIGWQAAKDQNPNISEMLNHLGGILRNNILLNSQEKILVGQEIQYVKDYLALEQIRYAERFTYSISVDDDLLSSFYIPKLSIQPIVENCIVHGFQGLSRSGVIEIRMWEDTDGIRCSVYDNGIGFDAEGYFERTATEPPDHKRSHIALHNIQERIHMLCGAAFGLQINSIPGKGTEVMILLPLDEDH